MDKLVFAHRLDSMLSAAFSDLIDSLILCPGAAPSGDQARAALPTPVPQSSARPARSAPGRPEPAAMAARLCRLRRPLTAAFSSAAAAGAGQGPPAEPLTERRQAGGVR